MFVGDLFAWNPAGGARDSQQCHPVLQICKDGEDGQDFGRDAGAEMQGRRSQLFLRS